MIRTGVLPMLESADSSFLGLKIAYPIASFGVYIYIYLSYI